MFKLNFANILIIMFMLYIGHTIWTLSNLFYVKSCVEPVSVSGAASANQRQPYCIPSWLFWKKRLLLGAVYGSSTLQVSSPQRYLPSQLIYSNHSFDPQDTFTSDVNVTLPKKTINNGSYYIHFVILAPDSDLDKPIESKSVISKAYAQVSSYSLPKTEAFNLMGTNSTESTNVSSDKPVTHLYSKITLSIMADNVSLDRSAIPAELHPMLRVEQYSQSYLPFMIVDQLSFRRKDLVRIDRESSNVSLTLAFQPISAGKLRFWRQLEASFVALKHLGFGEKEVDEVKGILVGTSLYLLMVTVSVSAVHLLFDFLAFKNDISYWKKRQTMVGLSSRVVVWRCVSTIIIFLYLMDEDTSLLVLVPTGISAVIEVWKLKKALKISFSLSNGIQFGSVTDKERETEEFDAVAMSYLSYLLYPLLAAGAVYSLIYTPHKSWYSWCLQSLVNGVYAFGFLFMLPQLFVNYKLKSVAHLPWRAFMYKAFNTFIDDLFAFIITMPTAHRLACFRDDVVFLVYLYQRWLYPVDKSRVNEFGQCFEEPQNAGGDKTKTD